MQIQKLKLGQQNNDEGLINLAGANKKATLKCKKVIIKKLAKLYQSVHCHSTLVSCLYNNNYMNIDNDIDRVHLWLSYHTSIYIGAARLWFTYSTKT